MTTQQKQTVFITMTRRSQEDFQAFLFDNTQAQSDFAKKFLFDLIFFKLESSEIQNLLKNEGFDKLEDVPMDVLELWCCHYDLGYVHLERKPIHSNLNFMKLWG